MALRAVDVAIHRHVKRIPGGSRCAKLRGDELEEVGVLMGGSPLEPGSKWGPRAALTKDDRPGAWKQRIFPLHGSGAGSQDHGIGGGGEVPSGAMTETLRSPLVVAGGPWLVDASLHPLPPLSPGCPLSVSCRDPPHGAHPRAGRHPPHVLSYICRGHY